MPKGALSQLCALTGHYLQEKLSIKIKGKGGYGLVRYSSEQQQAGKSWRSIHCNLSGKMKPCLVSMKCVLQDLKEH